jgi:GNAT superfamily N-acetyltransferase
MDYAPAMATSSVSIRRANQKDVPLLIILWNEYWPEEVQDTIAANPRIGPYLKTRPDMPRKMAKWFRAILRSRKYAVFLAEVNGTTAGFLTASSEKNWIIYQNREFAYLGVLFVRKSYRGRGISSGLVKEASRWARQRKLKHLGLTVFCGNHHAEEIYRGWNFVGVNQFMQKRL